MPRARIPKSATVEGHRFAIQTFPHGLIATGAFADRNKLTVTLQGPTGPAQMEDVLGTIKDIIETALAVGKALEQLMSCQAMLVDTVAVYDSEGNLIGYSTSTLCAP